MKIYCVLFDTMPFLKFLLGMAKTKGFNVLRSISKCYTYATLISMMTGKLGYELKKHGIGHGDFPKRFCLTQILPELFRRAGWKIHLHGKGSNFVYNCCINESLDNTHTDILIGSNKENYQKEKEFIRREQNIKSKQDIMYFFYYSHFHGIEGNEEKQKEAKEMTQKLISFWDFSETNAMFWFFSDHGNWSRITTEGYLPRPENYLTWVLFKDNIQPPIEVHSKFISIRDFYATMIDKFKLKDASVVSDIHSIQEIQNKDRIYYIEDARSDVNQHQATTAIACKFMDWEGKEPKGILQVVYYEPRNEFSCEWTPLDDSGFMGNTIKAEIDFELKKALISKIDWIPR